jgi:phosphomannomutase
MRERGLHLSEILSAYPHYSILKGQVPLTPQRIPAMFTSLEQRYAASAEKAGVADTRDGLRVDWPTKWFHVRVSQTEPIVRVICEHRGVPPRMLFQQLMDQVREYAA